MTNVLSYLRKGDRAILNYTKDGYSEQLIVQVIDELENDLIPVRLPERFMDCLQGFVKYEGNYKEKDWGVILVSREALNSCRTPTLKLVK